MVSGKSSCIVLVIRTSSRFAMPNLRSFIATSSVSPLLAGAFDFVPQTSVGLWHKSRGRNGRSGAERGEYERRQCDPGRAGERAGRPGPVRDFATTAVILGIAGAAWFSWGQARPPAGWSAFLEAGAIAGVCAAVAGGIAAWRHRGGETAMSDPRSRRGYWRVVATEAAAAGLGVGALAVAGRSAYAAAWVLLVVGIHFLPLSRLFGNRGLFAAGLLLSVVAVAAAATGAATAVAPSAVASAGGGLICVAVAASCLVRAVRPGAAVAAKPGEPS